MLGWQTSTGLKKKRPRWTQYDMLLSGPKADANVEIVQSELMQGQDGYVLLSAVMSIGNKQIDLRYCGETNRDEPPPQTAYKGSIFMASGAPPTGVEKDAQCAIDVTGDGKYRCRFVITCGGQTLFGATRDVGYTVCGVITDKGKANLVAEDAGGENRPEPELWFDERKGEATLRDPKWEIGVKFKR